MKRFTDFNGNGLTGGAPFYNEDFYDVELEKYELLKEIFENIVKAGSVLQSCVISGMAVTANGGNWDIAAGLVYLETAAGREFYRYDGDTNIASATLYLVPAADASENRTYADGVSKEFFVTKKAALGTNETGAIVFDPVNAGADLVYFSDMAANLAPAVSTFTPTIAFGGASVGVTYDSQFGEKIKTFLSDGKIKVEFQIRIEWNDKGSSAGTMTIEGITDAPDVSKFGDFSFLENGVGSSTIAGTDLKAFIPTGGGGGIQVLKYLGTNSGWGVVTDADITQIGGSMFQTIFISGNYTYTP
jgi:hypothetical protein